MNDSEYIVDVMKPKRIVFIAFLAVLATVLLLHVLKDPRSPVSEDPEIPEEPVVEIETEEDHLLIIYAGGQDDRNGPLDAYGRIDANLLLCFHEQTEQLMIIGIPRDAYLPNPALDHGLDKLTHLGNHGVENTMQGLEEYLEIDIDHYLLTDFSSFKQIVDILGGVDLENPYAFTAAGDENQSAYVFEQGNIHLDGDAALAYCRERHDLEQGDFDRNEHQALVMKAMLEKASSVSVEDAMRILMALQGKLLSDLELSDVLGLLGNRKDAPDTIVYHLSGRGDMQPTASMGEQKLYVVHLDEEEIRCMQEELKKMNEGEIVKK